MIKSVGSEDEASVICSISSSLELLRWRFWVVRSVSVASLAAVGVEVCKAANAALVADRVSLRGVDSAACSFVSSWSAIL